MLGYRTVLLNDGSPTFAEHCATAFGTWLRWKGYPADTAAADGVRSLRGDSTINRESLATEGGWAIRRTLIELRNGTTWTTRLTVAQSSGVGEWVQVDVESDRADPGWIASPRLIRLLLEETSLWDGVTRISSAPMRIGPQDCESTIHSLRDPGRRLPVSIATSPAGIPIARWRSFVERFTRETVGMSTNLVTDEGTTQALNALLPPEFRISPGAIRTFLPGADLSDPFDARRHRFLGSSRLARGVEDPRQIERAVGWAIRRATIGRPLPDFAREIDRAFDRQAAQPVRIRTDESVGEQAPAPGMERIAIAAFGDPEMNAQRVTALVAIVEQAARDVTNHASFSREQDRLAARIDDLEFKLEQAERVSDDKELDLADSQDRLFLLQDQVRRLQSILARTQAPDDAWLAPSGDEITHLPADISEALDWLDAKLEFVEFTGDSSIAVELEQHDPLGRWAGVIWSHLEALNEYAQCKRDGDFAGSLYEYLKTPPPGRRAFPVRAYAATESDGVLNNARMREARVFAVPNSVDPDGYALFAAHTKIASFGMVSPRMHLLDRTADSSRVYVGYIGPHLETPGTN